MIADLQEMKAAADAAFKEGRLEEAASLYKELILLDPTNAAALCNSSAVALKCGWPEDALNCAERALQLLSQQATQGDASCQPQLAKAYHRKAQAWVGLGSLITAVKVYRQGLATCRGCEEELLAALRITTDLLPPSWLAKYWARLIEEAQAPNPLSSRDGRLLRTVPPERRLSPEALQVQLEQALREGLQDEARDLMCAAWARGRKPGRAEVAFLRAAAYLGAGNPQLALRDVKLALVYGPQATVINPNRGNGSGNSKALVTADARSGRGGSTKDAAEPAPPAVIEVPCWPAALALQSAVQEGLGDSVPAALAMAKALELDPESEAYAAALQRLMRRIPEEYARMLEERGSAGLEACLLVEKEQRLPEFLRKRPKYYYYYEWMRKRITEQYPELPEPVMDKLLTIEASELDLILQYPPATQQTVERVLGVYREHGEAYLETYRVPLLNWEEVKALKGPGTIGLPLGNEAFGGLMEGLGMIQNPPSALPEAEEEEDTVLQIAGTATSALLTAPEAIPAQAGAGQGVLEAAAAQAPPPSSLAGHSMGVSIQQEEDAASDGSESVEEFSDLYELD